MMDFPADNAISLQWALNGLVATREEFGIRTNFPSSPLKAIELMAAREYLARHHAGHRLPGQLQR